MDISLVNILGEIKCNMIGKIFNKVNKKVDMDYLIRMGIIGIIEYCGVTLNNYGKRRDVGFGILDSLGGAFDETGRRAMADFRGENFQEDRKVIEFMK